MAMPRRKIIDYSLNALLVLIILIFFIPSWRIAFQGWFQGLFMPGAEFQKELSEKIPDDIQNWALFDMNDQLHSFKDYSGKPVLLSFWATWCPPCRAELPELKEIQTDLYNQLHVIAVSEETIETIKGSGLHEDYPFLYSTPGIPSFFNINTYPTLLIIDKHMRIVYRNTGAAELNTPGNKTFLQNLIQES